MRPGAWPSFHLGYSSSPFRALLMIPPLLDRGSWRRVNMSLDRGLLEAIDYEAKQRRMSRSAFLATAARRETEAT